MGVGQLRPLDQQVVVVVGASSGIGRETARRFGARGAKVEGDFSALATPRSLYNWLKTHPLARRGALAGLAAGAVLAALSPRRGSRVQPDRVLARRVSASLRPA